MTVFVNDIKIRIFRGATVRDVLLRFAVRKGLDLSKVYILEVADKWGHKLDHAAPLQDNQITKITNI